MKPFAHALPLGGLVLAGALAGCSLPISQTPTPFLFPTPNLTMTAIFSPPVLETPTAEPPVQPTTQPPVVEPTQAAPTATANPPAPIPTNTVAAPTATPTAETPSGPNAPKTQAAFLSTPPKIDGVWDEWKTTQYPVKNVVYQPKNWRNSDDLEGAFRIGWDANYLYLAVKVTDDKYVQNSTGHDLYLGDSIELLVDTNLAGDLGNRSLTGDDYQIGLSAGKGAPGKNPEAYRWYPNDKAGSLTDVKIAAVGGDGLYRIEAAIPWADLGVTPADGQQMGFTLSISDNDDPTKAVQQKMVSNAVSRVLTDPTSWGTLTLVK